MHYPKDSAEHKEQLERLRAELNEQTEPRGAKVTGVLREQLEIGEKPSFAKRLLNFLGLSKPKRKRRDLDDELLAKLHADQLFAADMHVEAMRKAMLKRMRSAEKDRVRRERMPVPERLQKGARLRRIRQEFNRTGDLRQLWASLDEIEADLDFEVEPAFFHKLNLDPARN